MALMNIPANSCSISLDLNYKSSKLSELLERPALLNLLDFKFYYSFNGDGITYYNKSEDIDSTCDYIDIFQHEFLKNYIGSSNIIDRVLTKYNTPFLVIDDEYRDYYAPDNTISLCWSGTPNFIKYYSRLFKLNGVELEFSEEPSLLRRRDLLDDSIDAFDLHSHMARLKLAGVDIYSDLDPGFFSTYIILLDPDSANFNEDAKDALIFSSVFNLLNGCFSATTSEVDNGVNFNIKVYPVGLIDSQFKFLYTHVVNKYKDYCISYLFSKLTEDYRVHGIVAHFVYFLALSMFESVTIDVKLDEFDSIYLSYDFFIKY